MYRFICTDEERDDQGNPTEAAIAAAKASQDVNGNALIPPEYSRFQRVKNMCSVLAPGVSPNTDETIDAAFPDFENGVCRCKSPINHFLAIGDNMDSYCSPCEDAVPVVGTNDSKYAQFSRVCLKFNDDIIHSDDRTFTHLSLIHI